MLLGGLFLLTTLSVIGQVTSFKLTGKRILRMAPLHHHFELLGWGEVTIVIRFWILQGSSSVRTDALLRRVGADMTGTDRQGTAGTVGPGTASTCHRVLHMIVTGLGCRDSRPPRRCWIAVAG